MSRKLLMTEEEISSGKIFPSNLIRTQKIWLAHYLRLMIRKRFIFLQYWRGFDIIDKLLNGVLRSSGNIKTKVSEGGCISVSGETSCEGCFSSNMS